MTPIEVSEPLYQGATFKLVLERVFYPYEVKAGADQVVRVAATGEPAPDTDRIAESYLGCDASVTFVDKAERTRDIATLTTTPNAAGSAVFLSGSRLTLLIADEETSAYSGWAEMIGDVNVTRADGTVERQYIVTVPLHPRSDA